MQENELRRILGTDLGASRIIDEKIGKAYEKIRRAEVKPKVMSYGRRNPVLRRIVVGIGSVAAVFALMITFCVMNPVFASEIPIFGGIFSKLSELFSFGRLPEEETVILYQENGELSGDAAGEQTENANAYQKTSGDITITLTEEYATNQAVFIGVNVKNAQEFPKMERYPDGTQNLSVETAEQYSFREDIVCANRPVEGQFTDAHTFDGILRIDYSDIDCSDRKYQQMLEEAVRAGADITQPEYWLTDENYDQYIEKYEIPETFTMKLDISNIVGQLEESLPVEGGKSKEELERMTDEEWWVYMESLMPILDQYPNAYENWWQEGSWSYELTITKKDSASRVIEVNQTNEARIGVASIELSSVEMTLNTVEKGADTFAVALDADGNKIENGSSNVYELAIAGHDISKVYIYICDYDEYMDEIKGYGIPGNNLDRSFQEVLEERALFKTVVETGYR